MAPELIVSDENSYDSKVDVWAIGCIIYYMLSGKNVFQGDSINQLEQKILQDEPNFDDLKIIAGPESISLIKMCLNKDPSERASAL